MRHGGLLLGRSPATLSLPRARIPGPGRRTGLITVPRDVGRVLAPLPGTQRSQGGTAASGRVGGGATSLVLGGPLAPALCTYFRALPARLPTFDHPPRTGLVGRAGHPHRLPDRGGGTRACATRPPVCARDTLRRRQRLIFGQRRVEEAERAEREAAAAMTRAARVVDRSARARDSVAAATPPPPRREYSTYTRGRNDRGTKPSWTAASRS